MRRGQPQYSLAGPLLSLCIKPLPGGGAKTAGSLVRAVPGATEPTGPPKNCSHHLAVVLARNSEPPGLTVPVNELTTLSSSIWANGAGHPGCLLGQDWEVQIWLASPDSAIPGFSL